MRKTLIAAALALFAGPAAAQEGDWQDVLEAARGQTVLERLGRRQPHQ